MYNSDNNINHTQPIYMNGYQQNQQGNQQFYQPQPPQNYGRPPKNGGSGTAVIAVVMVLLFLAILGVILYMVGIIPISLDKSKSKSKSESSAVQYLMPDLVGQDYNASKDMLESSGFTVGVEMKFSDDYAVNTVIGQDVEPGTVIEEGSVIQLTVSSGAETKMVTVPNVVGETMESGMSMIQAAGLTATIVYEDSRNVPNYVLKQDAAANTQVAEGSIVTLTISQSAAPAAASAYGKVVTKESDLYVRGAPSLNGKKLGLVKRNSTVEIVGQSGNWYQIKYNGGYGFVSKDYIIITE